MLTSAAPKIFARHVYVLLIGLGVVSAVAIMGILFLLTARIDNQSMIGTHNKVELLVEEWSNSLRSNAEDSAYWTVAYEVTSARDSEAVFSNLGSSAVESEVFDWLVILSADGMMLYEYGFPEALDATKVFDSKVGTTLLAQLREHAPDDYISITGPVNIDGHAVLTTTAWITPDDTTGLDVANFPIFIVGRDLNGAALLKMGASAGADELKINLESQEISVNSVLLNGPMGSIGSLSWSPSLPGSSFRQDMLPWLSLLCLAITLVTFSVARSFRKTVDGLNAAENKAQTDELTGVPNRLGLYTVLQSPWLDEVLAKGEFALLNIDLNNFKALNDERGHSAGDVALKITAKRLKSSLRRGDYVIRMGGDEFLCLIVDPNPKIAAMCVSNRIAEQFKTPMEFKGSEFTVRPSIGIAIGEKGEEWESLLERSDKAMYWAKTHGTTQHVSVSDEIEPVLLAG